MSELTFFLESGNITFMIAIGVAIMIIACELIALIVGTELISSIDSLFPIDINIDADVEVPTYTQLFDWLLVGKVPILMLILLFLSGYGISGLAIQLLLHTYLNFILPWYISGIIGFPFGILLLKIIGIPLAKIIPSEDDGTAITTADFINKIATITTGNASKTLLAEAKIDSPEIGLHYLQIKIDPDYKEESIPQGSTVIVRSLSKEGFYYVVPLGYSYIDVKGE